MEIFQTWLDKAWDNLLWVTLLEARGWTGSSQEVHCNISHAVVLWFLFYAKINQGGSDQLSVIHHLFKFQCSKTRQKLSHLVSWSVEHLNAVLISFFDREAKLHWDFKDTYLHWRTYKRLKKLIFLLQGSQISPLFTRQVSSPKHLLRTDVFRFRVRNYVWNVRISQ